MSAVDRPPVTVTSEQLHAFLSDYMCRNLHLPVREMMHEALTAAFPGRDPREVILQSVCNSVKERMRERGK